MNLKYLNINQVLVWKLQVDRLEFCLKELNTSGICNFDLLKLISKKNVLNQAFLPVIKMIQCF